jgi:hypothetical protein
MLEITIMYDKPIVHTKPNLKGLWPVVRNIKELITPINSNGKHDRLLIDIILVIKMNFIK